MRLTVCGAAGGEVTGSGYLVQTARATVLVDFGMFQGAGVTEERNRSLGPVEPSRLDAVVLTHAHLDHSGRLPLLGKHGLKCPIYSTHASLDFAELILEDSARLQEADAERDNRYNARAGRPPVAPLYTTPDLDVLRPLARAVPYGEQKEIAPGIRIRFYDAGHILGSTSVEMVIEENATTRTVVFSGDVGRWDTPFLRDPQPPPAADLVVLESTYGDRDHRSNEATITEFHGVLHDAIWNKQKILIPAFAIGRTQLLLFHIAELVEKGRIPQFPVYVDSPMATKATELYVKHQQLFDEEMKSRSRDGRVFQSLKQLRFVQTAQESRSLNDLQDAAVIIAGSGMCDGGRITHHLKHSLWKRSTSLIVVGFMARGSLGRRLVDGASHVEIHGSTVAVRAKIHTINGFSAHAGQGELLRWFEPMSTHRPRVLLTHGEDKQRASLSEALRARFKVAPELPAIGDFVEL